MFVRIAVLCGISLLFVAPPAALAQSGIASIYAYSGGKTASGEVASPSAITPTHQTLPFGTRVRVTNQRDKRSVVVRINDRGSFVKGCIIDFTPTAASVLGFNGLTPVFLEITRG